LPATAACSAALSCQRGSAKGSVSPRPLAMKERRPKEAEGPVQRVVDLMDYSVIRQELAAVEEGPVEVFVGLLLGSFAAAFLGEGSEGGFGGEFAEGADVEGGVGVVAHLGI